MQAFVVEVKTCSIRRGTVPGDFYGNLAKSIGDFVARIFPTGCPIVSAQGPSFGPIPEVKPHSVEQNVYVEFLRRQYSYVSIADRLKYEGPHRDDPALRLSALSERQMTAIDGQYALSGPKASLRARSLEMLHSDQVKKFISTPEFGFRRRMSPSPNYLPGQVSGAVEFAKMPPLPDEDLEMTSTPFLHEALGIPEQKQRRLLELLLTRSKTYGYHQQGLNLFANISNFGHVRSRDQVAGFLPHAFASQSSGIERLDPMTDPPIHPMPVRVSTRNAKISEMSAVSRYVNFGRS